MAVKKVREELRGHCADREIASLNGRCSWPQLMERILPRGGRQSHPATKVFQACGSQSTMNWDVCSGGWLGREILKPGGRWP